MNKFQFSALVFAMAIGSVAMADKATSIPQCADIAQKCEAAGLKPGMHKKNGEGLWVDCVRKIAKGGTVPNVSVSQSEAQSCLAAHKAMRQAKKSGQTAPVAAPAPVTK